jgi:hypothetical protein
MYKFNSTFELRGSKPLYMCKIVDGSGGLSLFLKKLDLKDLKWYRIQWHYSTIKLVGILCIFNSWTT